MAIDDSAATVFTGALARAEFGTAAGEGRRLPIDQGTSTANGNYTIAFTGGTLAITPAPLSATAYPHTKVYGTADPALSDTVAGLVDTAVDGVTIDDTAATAISGQLAADTGETVSAARMRSPRARSRLTATTISFTGSTLTITPAPLSVTADPQTKVYGTADPALTDTATGFVDSTVDGLTIDDTAATAL